MKNSRVKICTVGPYKRMDLRIDAHLSKNRGIFQGAVQLPFQYWTEIDGLRCAIVKVNVQSERRNFLARNNPINFMRHT